MYLYDNEYVVGSNIIVATATVLVWEVVTTMDDEINYIWRQPWTLGTFLFWANRYLPFVDTFMAIYIQFIPNISPKACHAYYTGMLWFIAFGLFIAESIILLRTWAIWQRTRAMFMCLLFISLITTAISITGIIAENQSFKFGAPPTGGFGCKLESSKQLIILPYISVGISETVVVLLTIARGLDHFRSLSRFSWVTRIYGYGLLFYIYLLCITIVNITIPIVAKEPRYKGYLAVAQHVFHSIFCTRVIILIQRQRWMRQSVSQDDNDDYMAQNVPMTKTRHHHHHHACVTGITVGVGSGVGVCVDCTGKGREVGTVYSTAGEVTTATDEGTYLSHQRHLGLKDGEPPSEYQIQTKDWTQ